MIGVTHRNHCSSPSSLGYGTGKTFLVGPREHLLIVFDKSIVIVFDCIWWIYKYKITFFRSLKYDFKIV